MTGVSGSNGAMSGAKSATRAKTIRMVRPTIAERWRRMLRTVSRSDSPLTRDELVAAMQELRDQGVDILTLGQYLRPSDGHLPVTRFYTPEEFVELRDIGRVMGYRHVESGPLARSSYHAWEQVQRAAQAPSA